MNVTQGPQQVRRGWIGAAAAVVAVVTVAGCSGEDIAERITEQAIERESGGDVDVDLDGGNIRVQTEDGSFEMSTDDDGNISIRSEDGEGQMSIDSEDGRTVIESDEGTAVIEQSADIPDDFPSSVPLPSGFEPQMVQSMASDDESGWVLTGPMSQTAAELAESYLPALESAGFERQSVTEAPDMLIFGFDNGEYAVTGVAGDDGTGSVYFTLTVGASQL